MREKRAQDVHHGVVYPMDGHTGQDAPRAVIHPAEQQTNEEGMGIWAGFRWMTANTAADINMATHGREKLLRSDLRMAPRNTVSSTNGTSRQSTK